MTVSEVRLLGGQETLSCASVAHRLGRARLTSLLTCSRARYNPPQALAIGLGTAFREVTAMTGLREAQELLATMSRAEKATSRVSPAHLGHRLSRESPTGNTGEVPWAHRRKREGRKFGFKFRTFKDKLPSCSPAAATSKIWPKPSAVPP